MVLSVAMMLTMFPTGVLADDFIENTEGVTVSTEGQSNDDQGEESDTAQVNAVENEETQLDTEKPENEQTEPEQTENDQTEPTQNETDQAAPDQTETNQTEQTEPGSTVPDQAGTTQQPAPEQPATDPAENGVSDGAENTEGEQAESKTEFTVTWESEGETILTKTFAEGTSKDEVEDAQPAEDPVKEADGDVAYEFAGWTPDYADVTADQTYTATFEEAEQDAQDEQDEMVSTASLVEPAASEVTKEAAIFCLIDPLKNPESNEPANWLPKAGGFYQTTSSLGNAKVTLKDGWRYGQRNYYLTDGNYSIVWPNGSAELSSQNNSAVWNAIVQNYKADLSQKLGVQIKDEDVESITLLPYKVSRNNSSKTDWHLDCQVQIKCKNIADVIYELKDVGAEKYVPIGQKRCTVDPAKPIFAKPEADIEQSKQPAGEKNDANGNTYIFSGWYTDQSYQNKATFPYPVTTSVTFYAKYIPAYTVTYTDGVDGEEVFADQKYEKCSEGTSTPTFAGTPTREGYEFNGWMPNVAATVTSNVTYVAQWKQSQFEVKYQYAGEVPENAPAVPGSQKATCNDQVTVAATPSLDGYVFHGWASEDVSVDQDGKFTMPAKDVTFTGTWEKRTDLSYRVEYRWGDTVLDSFQSEANMTFGATTEPVSPKAFEGYTIKPADDHAKTCEIGAGDNVIIFNYYKNVTLTANSNENPYIYDGKAKEVTGYTASDNAAKFEGITARGTGTNAGTHEVTFVDVDNLVGKISTDDKYIVTATTNGKLTIAKRNVTLKSVDLNKKYDGTALVNGDNKLATEEGWVSGEGATYTFTGSQTLVGSSANAFSYTLNDGTNADNYEIDKTEGTLTVTDRAANEKYEITVTAKSDTKTYNGKEQNVTGIVTNEFTVNGQKYTVSGLNAEAKGTNAGEYATKVTGTAVVKDAADNDVTAQFNVKTENGKLTIAKRKVTLKSADLNKKYDGTALVNGETALETETGWAEGEGATYAFTGSQTLVGSSDNEFTYILNEGTDAGNYTISTQFGKLKVTDREEGDKLKITVEANSGSKTYNGQPLTVEGFKTLSFEVEGNTYTVEGLTASATGTNVSDSKDVVVEGAAVVKDATGNDVTAQFKVETKNGQLTIKPVAIELTANSAEKPYDGKALTANGYEITKGAFADKEGLVSVTVEGSQTLVGSSDNTIKAHTLKDNTKAENYSISYQKGTLKVTDRADADKYQITVEANSDSKPYDGQSLTVNGFKTLSFEVEGNIYTVEGLSATATGTNVADSKAVEVKGTAKVLDADGNDVTAQFKVETKNGQLTISPVAIELTANSNSKAYDGKALTDSGYNITNGKFVGEEGLESVTVEGSQTLVGSSENTITGHALKNNTKAKNYTISYKKGTLTVTNRTEKYGIKVEANSGEKTYNGKPLTVEGFKTLSFEVEGNTYTVEGLTASATGTNVSDSKDVVVEGAAVVKDATGNDVTAQFKVETKNGQLTIKPVAIELTANSAEKPYDGKALTANGYEITKGAFADKEGLASVTVEGSQTLVGSSDNTIKAHTLKDNTKAENYSISYKPGTLTVTDRTEKYEITVEANSGEKTYDGKPLTVEGFRTLSFEVEGNTYTVEGLTATATGTNVSDSKAVKVTGTAKVLDVDGNDVTKQFTVTSKPGKLTINPYMISIEPTETTFKYNGEEPKVKTDKIEIINENGKGLLLDHYVKSIETEGSGVDADTYEWFSGHNAKIVDGKDNDVTANYQISYTAKTMTITPAPLTVTTEGGSKVYDGKPLTNEVGNIAGLVNGETAKVKTTGSQTNVGTSDNTYVIEWDTAKVGNYKVTQETLGTLEVTAQSINPKPEKPDPERPDEKDPAYSGVQIDSPSDSVYDGTEHKWVPTVLDKDGKALTNADYKVTYSTENFTDVTGTITVTITGAGNYTGTVTRTYKITPASLKITTNSAEKTYDGSALTAGGKIEGLVKGETATLKTTGSQTEVGNSKNTYEIVWDGTAKEANYTIAEEDIGTLTVNKRSSGGGSSSKPTPEEEPTPTPTPTPLPTLPTTPAPTTPARRVTRSTATVTQPTSRPSEQITENETPKAESEPEVIEDEETPLAPMAGGAWALVNLILMLLTVLASLLLLLGYMGKKKYAKEDEYGNALHDANGNEIIDYTRNKKGFWRVASLIPAIAAVIAFALTENMRLPMVMTDRWTLLMVIIAVVQLIVAVLCKKKKESEEDENQANA